MGLLLRCTKNLFPPLPDVYLLLIRGMRLTALKTDILHLEKDRQGSGSSSFPEWLVTGVSTLTWTTTKVERELSLQTQKIRVEARSKIKREMQRNNQKQKRTKMPPQNPIHWKLHKSLWIITAAIIRDSDSHLRTVQSALNSMLS